MRPLFRSLFVLSVFGLLAAHVSGGLLRHYLEGIVPGLLAELDRGLQLLLISPFGRSMAVNILLGAGAIAAIWAYMSTSQAAREGRGQRHSTW